MDKLLTPQEVADQLKIKKNTVYELIKRGELPSTKIGKQLRVQKSDLDVYLNRAAKPVKTCSQEEKYEAQQTVSEPESSPLKRDYLLHSSGIIISGQDPVLDVLCYQMESHPNGLPILRSYMGSYNSLYSLYFKKIHIAASDLWDGTTGEFNRTYVTRLVPGTPAVLLRLCCFMQGMYVKKGNPKRIKSILDLSREDVQFVNREKGSGTRVLIDELLRINQIEAKHVHGYKKEVLSHVSAAALVANGEADVAVGGESVLTNYEEIEFIPLQKTALDLVFLKEDSNKTPFQTVIEIVNSTNFQEEIRFLKGYDTAQTGNIINV